MQSGSLVSRLIIEQELAVFDRVYNSGKREGFDSKLQIDNPGQREKTFLVRRGIHTPISKLASENNQGAVINLTEVYFFKEKGYIEAAFGSAIGRHYIFDNAPLSVIARGAACSGDYTKIKELRQQTEGTAEYSTLVAEIAWGLAWKGDIDNAYEYYILKRATLEKIVHGVAQGGHYGKFIRRYNLNYNLNVKKSIVEGLAAGGHFNEYALELYNTQDNYLDVFAHAVQPEYFEHTAIALITLVNIDDDQFSETLTDKIKKLNLVKYDIKKVLEEARLIKKHMEFYHFNIDEAIICINNRFFQGMQPNPDITALPKEILSTMFNDFVKNKKYDTTLATLIEREKQSRQRLINILNQCITSLRTRFFIDVSQVTTFKKSCENSAASLVTLLKNERDSLNLSHTSGTYYNIISQYYNVLHVGALVSHTHRGV